MKVLEYDRPVRRPRLPWRWLVIALVALACVAAVRFLRDAMFE